MSFDDYTVTISFINFRGDPDINTFDVMAYDKQEAQDLAFSKFSDIHGDNYKNVVRFDVELTQVVECFDDYEEYDPTDHACHCEQSNGCEECNPYY